MADEVLFPPEVTEAFQRYVRSRAASPLQEEVGRLSATGALTRQALDAAIHSSILTPRQVIPELVDLVLYYIRSSLVDQDFSASEVATVRNLKRLFRIEEGDFLQHAEEEVAELLASELSRSLENRQIDDQDAVQAERLQEAFGLGYDQFLELTRPLYDEVVEHLWWEGSEKGWGVDELERRVSLLRTVYSLAPRIEGLASSALESFTAEPPPRHISQDVKDRVWRRDQGRCVECGSQDRLEFDHIIPFSRGGANTYRNVQLLCESCNRTKSGSIG